MKEKVTLCTFYVILHFYNILMALGYHRQQSCGSRFDVISELQYLSELDSNTPMLGSVSAGAAIFVKTLLIS